MTWYMYTLWKDLSNTGLSTTVTCYSLDSQIVFILITESLYPITKLSPFPPHQILVTTFLLCFYEVDFGLFFYFFFYLFM